MRLGIDMGGTTIKLGLVNDECTIVDRLSINTLTDLPAEVFVEKIGEAVIELVNKNNLKISELENIGIGCAGMIDSDNGVILYSNNFGWENVHIVVILEKNLGIRASIANDADAAVYGETVDGSAKGNSDAILITIGTGIGVGVVIDGRIFKGHLRGGCEAGHTVIKYGGRKCTCQRRGCFEAYASANALILLARRKAAKDKNSLMVSMCNGNLKNMNGKIPFDAALKGDITAINTIDEYEDYLSCGIVNLINTFRPSVVILGGGVAMQGDNLINPINEKIKGKCFGGDYGQMPKITVSKLKNDAGIIGAAYLV